jgi:CRP-like cAMP-binding protein
MAEHPAFHHLPQKTLHKLAKVVVLEQHQAGDFVYRMGEPAERVYFIVSGSCESFLYSPEDIKFFKASQKGKEAPQATPLDSLLIRRKGSKDLFAQVATPLDSMLIRRKGSKDLFASSAAKKRKEQAASDPNPLVYGVRARSMLKLSSLSPRSIRVQMLRRGAMTLDSNNWVSVQLSTDQMGTINAEPLGLHGRLGPFSSNEDQGPDDTLHGCRNERKNGIGVMREVWRAEELSVAKFEYMLRIEFVHGNLSCFCFDTEDERRDWARHLKIFRNEEDTIPRAFISTRSADAELLQGDVFGEEEMTVSNSIEAQTGCRKRTVLCKTDTMLLVLGRMDFLNIIEKQPIFTLHERLETTKLSGIFLPGDYKSLFIAARALVPMTLSADTVICRANTRVEFVYIVFRGFVSTCSDELELQAQPSEASSSSSSSSCSTYTSQIRRVKKLCVGEAFGHLDALKPQGTFVQTVIADTTAVLLQLPVGIYLECYKCSSNGNAGAVARAASTQDDLKDHPAAHSVSSKVGTAAMHLEMLVRDPNTVAPSIDALLNAHTPTLQSMRFPRRDCSDGVLNMGEGTSPDSGEIESSGSFVQPVRSTTPVITRNEIVQDSTSNDRFSFLSA